MRDPKGKTPIGALCSFGHLQKQSMYVVVGDILIDCPRLNWLWQMPVRIMKKQQVNLLWYLGASPNYGREKKTSRAQNELFSLLNLYFLFIWSDPVIFRLSFLIVHNSNWRKNREIKALVSEEFFEIPQLLYCLSEIVCLWRKSHGDRWWSLGLVTVNPHQAPDPQQTKRETQHADKSDFSFCFGQLNMKCLFIK